LDEVADVLHPGGVPVSCKFGESREVGSVACGSDVISDTFCEIVQLQVNLGPIGVSKLPGVYLLYIPLRAVSYVGRCQNRRIAQAIMEIG
jgi:hypothetical protein